MLVRRNTTLIPAQLASLRKVLAGEPTLRRLRAEGVRVDDVELLRFAETAVNPQLAPAAPPPQDTVGRDKVVFKLMLVGPAASVSNNELIRTLHSVVVSNLTSGPVDYVTTSNTRVLKVAVIPSSMVVPPAARTPDGWPLPLTRPADQPKPQAKEDVPAANAAAPSPPPPPQRRRLAQMLAGALPASVVPDAGVGDGDSHSKVPDLPPPNLGAATPAEGGVGTGDGAVTSPSTTRTPPTSSAASAGLPEPVPAVDVTFQVSRLPRPGAEALFTQLSQAIVTNYLTSAMILAGWNVNGVSKAALTAGSDSGWFSVNGRPFGETGRGGPPTFLSVPGPRERGTEPGVIAAAALIPALLAAGLAAGGWVAYKRSSTGGAGGGAGGGGWRGGKTGKAAVQAVGLAAAVAAAARAGSGAPSAAALLGIIDGGAGGGTAATPSSATAGGTNKDTSEHGGCGYAALAERDWQLDPDSLRILTRPDGSEWELGAGASGRVYKALLGGAQEVAVKIFSEKIPALTARAADASTAATSPSPDPPIARTRPAWLARLRRTSLPRDDDTAGVPGRDEGPPGASVSDPAGAAGGGGTGATALGSRVTSRSNPATASPAKGSADSQAGVSLNTQPHVASKRRVPLLEELAREVLLLRACHDRNIVSFVGASIQVGHAVLVTEFMPGGDLHAALAEDAASDKGRFTWRRRVGPTGPIPRTGLNRACALDIARGLHFLHARRIVHLDLKSPNILLARDGMAKIADVGLSELWRKGSGWAGAGARACPSFFPFTSSLNPSFFYTPSLHKGKVLRDQFVSTMHAVGTYAWAAPEVLMGQPTSEAADIYSFGVLLWELSVREAPAGRHLRPVQVPEEAPASVVDLMNRCLSADPATRPTALELVHFFVDLGRAGSRSGTTAEVVDAPPPPPAAPGPPPATSCPGSGSTPPNWLARRLSGRTNGSGKSSGGRATPPPPQPAAIVPASGFEGEGGAAGAAVPAMSPASGFGGDVEAPPPRPVSRPGVSGPPGKSAGEP